MKARIRNGMLTIVLQVIDPPRISKTGKRLLVASSRGVRRTSLRADNKPVDISAYAFIRPDEHQSKKEWEAPKSRARGKGSRIRRKMLKKWGQLL
jgi:hypothetical protein